MERKISPQGWFFIFLISLLGLNFILPFAKVIHSPYNWSGILFIAFGFVINIWADNLFKTFKTPVNPAQEPTYLITGGPFRFSRNPMYLGMAAILLGAAIVSRSLISFIFPAIFVGVMQKIFMPFEESIMESVFGNKYLYYEKKVRRWI
ncbi:MAG: isoprenylcysteine carboxylmethyltransferase family protein [Candidatus Omnitrophica bacterium]|nr:isoprenylcysteine carboxylmethyltransferase family protein [Candidatus Omnitrophota bacterium]